MQLLRTLADQVRKRERLKKQLLKVYRATVAAKVGRFAWIPVLRHRVRRAYRQAAGRFSLPLGPDMHCG